MPEDHIGTVEQWEHNQDILKNAITDMGKGVQPSTRGDGAFYGPKLDFHLADSLGRTWQCGTIQLDLPAARAVRAGVHRRGRGEAPPRHDPPGGAGQHRAVTLDRVFFAGAFPAWLSPVQVKVLPVTDRAAEYADQVGRRPGQVGLPGGDRPPQRKGGQEDPGGHPGEDPLYAGGGRPGYGERHRPPPRHRTGEDLGSMSLEQFAALLREEVDARTIK